jgi:hypothetical protein
VKGPFNKPRKGLVPRSFRGKGRGDAGPNLGLDARP